MEGEARNLNDPGSTPEAVAWWLEFEIRTRRVDQHITPALGYELCDEVLDWAGDRHLGVGGGEWPDVKSLPGQPESWICKTGVEQHAPGIEFLPRACVNSVYDEVVLPWAIRHDLEARLIGIEPQPAGWELRFSLVAQEPECRIEGGDIDELLYKVLSDWGHENSIDLGEAVNISPYTELGPRDYVQCDWEVYVAHGAGLDQTELKVKAGELLNVVLVEWACAHGLRIVPIEGGIRAIPTEEEILREIEAKCSDNGEEKPGASCR